MATMKLSKSFNTKWHYVNIIISFDDSLNNDDETQNGHIICNVKKKQKKQKIRKAENNNNNNNKNKEYSTLFEFYILI